MNRNFGGNSGGNIRFTLILMDWGICKLHWSGVKHRLLNNVYYKRHISKVANEMENVPQLLILEKPYSMTVLIITHKIKYFIF